MRNVTDVVVDNNDDDNDDEVVDVVDTDAAHATTIATAMQDTVPSPWWRVMLVSFVRFDLCVRARV